MHLDDIVPLNKIQESIRPQILLLYQHCAALVLVGEYETARRYAKDARGLEELLTDIEIRYRFKPMTLVELQATSQTMRLDTSEGPRLTAWERLLADDLGWSEK